ncbi:hypothetical protein FKM82_026301 [Ascaphus truei]
MYRYCNPSFFYLCGCQVYNSEIFVPELWKAISREVRFLEEQDIGPETFVVPQGQLAFCWAVEPLHIVRYASDLITHHVLLMT